MTRRRLDTIWHSPWWLAVLVLASAGCRDPDRATPPSTAPSLVTSGSAATRRIDEIQAFFADPNAPLTGALLEQLLLNVRSCTLTQWGINPACPAYVLLGRGLARIPPPPVTGGAGGESAASDAMLEERRGLALKHLSHESDPVRYQAALLAGEVAPGMTALLRAFVARAQEEPNPMVLSAVLHAIGPTVSAEPRVRELLLAMADHEREPVRREALGWLSSNVAERVPGALEKVLAKVATDPSKAIRALLCSRIGASGDPRAIDLFDKVLLRSSPGEVSQELFAGCWSGVISAWTGAPPPARPSKRAFEITLEVLRARPRTRQRPPTSSIPTLATARTELLPGDRAARIWLEQVKPWYRKEALLDALEAVATDDQASLQARILCLQAMERLGVKAGRFEKLLEATPSDAKGDAARLRAELDRLASRVRGAPAPR